MFILTLPLAYSKSKVVLYYTTMITKVEYMHRITNINDFDNLQLPNAYKVYIQCRSQVPNPISSNIYSFESSSAKIYITGNTLLEITIFDYASLVANDTNIKEQIIDILQQNGVQMKMCFVVKL